ncbi:MAG: hypothetical protein COW71_09830 [Ignavibacteriales bacterium CG18_big_fil_WC_8_21_14_2_50_31_20]|nr:MAG: hypothetical protein COW71_09830 [Ignavibacteriales bacterium CG18_big_fil_WC_8_21_14_2_50_31_20]
MIHKYGMSTGNDNEIFGLINCFAIDKNENLYVADGAFKTIKKFSTNGKYLKTFGAGEGEGPGEFESIQDMDVDSLGNLYIVDKILRRVTVLDSANNILFTFKLPFIPAQITVPQSFNAFITGFPFSYNGDMIYKYDLTSTNYDNPAKIFCARIKNKDSLTIEMAGNSGRLSKDNNGNIIFSFFFPYETRVFSLNGKLLKSFHRNVSFFRSPYFDSEKRYVIAPSGNRGVLFFPPNIIANLIYKANGEKTSAFFIDFFDYNNQFFLGTIDIKDIGIEKIRYIKTDAKGYVYIDILEPYPQILKYKMSVKN